MNANKKQVIDKNSKAKASGSVERENLNKSMEKQNDNNKKANHNTATLNKNSDKNPTLPKNKGSNPDMTKNISNKNDKNTLGTKKLDNDEKTKLKKKQEQAKQYDQYIQDSGLPIAFQMIYGEIITKHINPDNFFTYTSMRLRQIGKEIEDIKDK